MATNGEYFASVAHQYPQPSRPLHADYDVEAKWTTESGGYNRVHNHEDDDLRQFLRGFVDDLDERGFEKFKKLISKVENKVPIERLLKESLHDFKGRHVSEVFEKLVGKLNSGEVRDRDVNGGVFTAAEGEELRVERFKVKTVNVVGVGDDKEEQN
ncbi:hypothetical protein CDL12_13523 [Handroanthus impetiginosus]|uniref:Uncharacterized protein n=1 Tax=Handroanthus impetiginosus TaxID=429701 RepID=A0A2G9H8K0_9LAMI|nr:hypothetical protein CDL12_13520 [Handroanthus impetiginosus]PIN13851.1 hypothetical protein CDL12_13523 [Handroanthus impetiginosus]